MSHFVSPPTFAYGAPHAHNDFYENVVSNFSAKFPMIEKIKLAAENTLERSVREKFYEALLIELCNMEE